MVLLLFCRGVPHNLNTKNEKLLNKFVTKFTPVFTHTHANGLQIQVEMNKSDCLRHGILI